MTDDPMTESPAVQDTDRLREVAARTQWYRDRLSGDGLGEWDDAHESDRREYLVDAAAVLAAVLPAHRAQVAEEMRPFIAKAVEEGIAQALAEERAAVRRLAAATPPGSPLVAERATAASEEAPTPQEPSGAVYRTGRKVGRTIYRDDVLIGVMDTPELAALAVAAMNRAVPEGDDPWRRRIDVSTLYGYELGAGDLAGVEAELDKVRGEAIDLTDQLGDLRATVAGTEADLDEARAERDRLAETIRRYEPVIEAAKARAQVIRDCAEFGSGSEGWYERDRASDRAIVATTAALGDIPSPTAPEAPDDLDRFIAEQMHDPEFRAAWERLPDREPAPVEPEGTPDA